MELTVKTKALAQALQTISLAIPGKPILVISGHVRFVADANWLKLTATNLDLWISTKIECDMKTAGDCCIPFSILNRLIGRLNSVEVSFELKDSKVEIKTADFSSSIDILPAADFPPAIPMENAKSIKIESEQFIKPLQMVKHAMADDTSGDYAITGVNIATAAKGLSFAATNKNRIAVFNSSIQFPEVNVIVPGATIEAIVKNADGTITVEISDGAIQVTGDNTRLVSRLLEAKFPSYQQVIPELIDTAFVCDGSELLEAIRTASLFLGVQDFALTLAGKGKHLELSCEGKATARIMGSELSGQPKFAIKFNHRFMSDVLEVLDRDEVRIECADQNSARVIREGNLIAVLAPIKVATQ